MHKKYVKANAAAGASNLLSDVECSTWKDS